MARPKEQTAHRSEIVAATQRAIATRGLAGLRIKDVARERVLRTGCAQGVFSLDPDAVGTVAANSVALEDAYGPHLVGRNAHVDPGQARRNIRAYLSTVTGTELRG